MAGFVPILNGDNGVGVRAKLNHIGSDVEITFRIVSAFAEIENEIEYFQTGTLVFAVAERLWYKYSGATWVENSDLPSLNYVVFMEIDHTDTPYSIGAEQVLFCNTTVGNITVNLPSQGTGGLRYKIKNIGSGIVTIDGFETNTIDGETTFDLYDDESIEIVATSLGWHIL